MITAGALVTAIHQEVSTQAVRKHQLLSAEQRRLGNLDFLYRLQMSALFVDRLERNKTAKKWTATVNDVKNFQHPQIAGEKLASMMAILDDKNGSFSYLETLHVHGHHPRNHVVKLQWEDEEEHSKRLITIKI